MKKLDQVIYSSNLYIYTWHGHEIANFIDILFTLLQNPNISTHIVEKKNTFKLYVTVEKILSNKQIHDFRVFYVVLPRRASFYSCNF